MNGRMEHKIKSEKLMKCKISDNKNYIFGFYNYLSSKYEHKTKETYVGYVNKFIKHVNKDINDIIADDIIGYLNDLHYKINNKGEYIETSGTYRATVHSALKLYFNYLSETNKIKDNPMIYVPRPKNKKNNQINRTYLTPDEMQKLVNNINNSNLKEQDKNNNLLIVMIFLYTGIRCTALTEINIEDFDIKNKTLKVIDKRDKIRTFKIDDELISLYDKVRHNRVSGALFLSNRRQRISQRTVSRIIEKYTSDLNKHITPHKLRHSFGTNLYNETKDIYVVKNALGHENLSTTQLYVHKDDIETSIIGMNAMKKNVSFSTKENNK